METWPRLLRDMKSSATSYCGYIYIFSVHIVVDFDYCSNFEPFLSEFLGTEPIVIYFLNYPLSGGSL